MAKTTVILYLTAENDDTVNILKRTCLIGRKNIILANVLYISIYREYSHSTEYRKRAADPQSAHEEKYAARLHHPQRQRDLSAR